MIQNLFFYFFLFFRGVGSLSQPGLNIFTVDNMGVMICLGQGGLRSLSASSFSFAMTFRQTAPCSHSSSGTVNPLYLAFLCPKCISALLIWRLAYPYNVTRYVQRILASL